MREVSIKPEHNLDLFQFKQSKSQNGYFQPTAVQGLKWLPNKRKQKVEIFYWAKKTLHAKDAGTFNKSCSKFLYFSV